MDWQFDSLKAFQVENDFFREIGSKSKVLHMYLKDLMKNPNQHSLGLFRDATLRNPPLQCAYDFISKFEQDETNPLIAAMNADVAKTWSTYEKWRKITGDVLTSFLYLETMVNGLFWQRNMYGPNKLEQQIYGIYGRLDWLRENYKKTYWDGFRGAKSPVRALVESIQENSNIKSNDDKAVKITEGLDAMMTENNHCFYVIVYDDVSNLDHHSFSGNEDQYMTSFHHHGSNVVIYRSYHFKDSSHEEYQKLKDECESQRNSIGRWWDYKKLPAILRQEKIHNTGMIGAIRKEHHVAVRSAKSGAEYGPGWWLTAIARSNHLFKIEEPLILIAGYK